MDRNTHISRHIRLVVAVCYDVSISADDTPAMGYGEHQNMGDLDRGSSLPRDHVPNRNFLLLQGDFCLQCVLFQCHL